MREDTKYIRYTQRLEENLYNKIKSLAKEAKRSMCKQVEYILEKYINETD